MHQITRTFAERIIRHELGHWIAAKALNFQPKRFSIEFTDDHTSYQGESEIGLHTLITAPGDTKSYLERRIIVLASGAAAEALEGEKVNRPMAFQCLMEGGKTSDLPRFRELIQLLRNIEFSIPTTDAECESQLKVLDDGLSMQAIELVEKEATLINKLASKLTSRLAEKTSSSMGARWYEVTLTAQELLSVPEMLQRFPSNDAKGRTDQL
ncbi:MAG: hypothetical protein ACLPKT_15825 [Methylocella sp.]